MDDNHNTDAADDPLECCFCGDEQPSVRAAIAACWIPRYWDGDSECEGPVCAACVESRLRFGDDGELELIPTT